MAKGWAACLVSLLVAGCGSSVAGRPDAPVAATDAGSAGGDDAAGGRGGFGVDGGERSCVDAAASCDGAPAWRDAYGDGSLRLGGTSKLGIDAAPPPFSTVCTRDAARIDVCGDETTIVVEGEGPAVIGGDGIGPLAGQAVTVNLEIPAAPTAFVLADCTMADVSVYFDAPQTALTLTSKGPHALHFGGQAALLHVVTDGPGIVDRDTNVPGGADVQGGGGPLPAPDCVVGDPPGPMTCDSGSPTR